MQWEFKEEHEGRKRKQKLEMEKLRLESERLNEHRSASSEDQQAAFSQASQNTVTRTKAPVLLGFVDGKDNLDSFLFRFERYATVAGWERFDWATRLSPLLSAEHWMSTPDCQTNKQGIMISYRRLFYRGDFTEQDYPERFRRANPEGQKSASLFIVRISNYFDKWVELADGDKIFRRVSELMVR